MNLSSLVDDIFHSFVSLTRTRYHQHSKIRSVTTGGNVISKLSLPQPFSESSIAWHTKKETVCDTRKNDCQADRFIRTVLEHFCWLLHFTYKYQKQMWTSLTYSNLSSKSFRSKACDQIQYIISVKKKFHLLAHWYLSTFTPQHQCAYSLYCSLCIS